MTTDLPSSLDLLNPTLKALQLLGGSGSILEIANIICEMQNFSEEQQSIPHKNGPQTEILYRLAWARTYLRIYGLIENKSHGVWSLTNKGKETESVNPKEVNRIVSSKYKKTNQVKSNPEPLNDLELHNTINEIDEISQSEQLNISDESGTINLLKTLLEGAIPFKSELWSEQLLDVLLDMPPDSFERLCQRLLRESGFIKVNVTGRKGDGGIDGIGVLKIALLSFQVLFQCKRYRGIVGPGEIRDFRGAMVGRTDKGLFITTGRFSRSAEQEATRDGAPAIELIDGQELCLLLANLQIGITRKTIEVVEINNEYFKNV